MTTTAYRVLGTTDDVTKCDQCGREGLTHTVALSIGEDGTAYYGSTCAANALSGRVGSTFTRADVERAADEAQRSAAAGMYAAMADARATRAEILKSWGVNMRTATAQQLADATRRAYGEE